MMMRFSELPAGSCFVTKRGRTVRKKLDGSKVVTVSAAGRVRTRNQKGDPNVNSLGCPLTFLGVGLRKHPEQVVEIGTGRPRKYVNRRLK